MTGQQQGRAGQQGLTDDTSEFNKVAFVVRQALGRVSTMKLVRIVAVHAPDGLENTGTVDVLPLVDQADGLGNTTPMGTVFGLIYFRMQGGANAVIMDPAVGDIGLAVVADRDISAVKATRDQAPPGSKRRFSIPDGVYIGGVLNGAPTCYIQFTDGGFKIVDASGHVLEAKASGFSLTGNLAVTGNITATGAIHAGEGTGDRIGLQTHLHTSGGAGSPTSVPTAGT